MTYEVRVARTAARQLGERLAHAVVAACAEFIFGPLVEHPHQVGAPLRQPYEGQWRARRGEYRVRYTIDDIKGIVAVLDVDHRWGIYRRP